MQNIDITKCVIPILNVSTKVRYPYEKFGAEFTTNERKKTNQNVFFAFENQVFISGLRMSTCLISSLSTHH